MWGHTRSIRNHCIAPISPPNQTNQILENVETQHTNVLFLSRTLSPSFSVLQIQTQQRPQYANDSVQQQQHTSTTHRIVRFNVTLDSAAVLRAASDAVIARIASERKSCVTCEKNGSNWRLGEHWGH